MTHGMAHGITNGMPHGMAHGLEDGRRPLWLKIGRLACPMACRKSFFCPLCFPWGRIRVLLALALVRLGPAGDPTHPRARVFDLDAHSHSHSRYWI